MPVTAQDLTTLRASLLAADLRLPLADADRARAAITELVAQIDDYLLPRLQRLDAPLLAVLGGSTGAGKSTLANSLLGVDVTLPGVLRPTTRAPVLACNPADRDWFMGDGVLPDLPRTTGDPGEASGTAGLHIVAHPAVPAGLGLLDSPDIDSVEARNHDLATQLLGAADLWLFVTTAARYADAVPWAYLARARERAAALAVVVNRIPPSDDGSSVEIIRTAVERMLADNGLGDTPVFALEEGVLVDERIVAGLDPLREWLTDLVRDEEARRETIRRTVEGAVASLPGRVERVAHAVAAQVAAVADLRAAAAGRYDDAIAQVGRELGGGAMLRGEVLDRFREHVGTADWMDRLQRGVGALRDRARAAVTGEPTPVQQATGQIRSDLSTLVLEAIAEAAAGTVDDWTHLPGGRAVLDDAVRRARAADADDLRRPAPRTPDTVRDAVQQWQEAVLAMVREHGGAKASLARGLSLGVNGIGVALMVAVFASTGGLTGSEVAIAGGTGAVSQALLSAVFGEQAVRQLARDARADLLERVGMAATSDRARFDRVIADLPSEDDARALRDTAAAIRRAS